MKRLVSGMILKEYEEEAAFSRLFKKCVISKDFKKTGTI